MKEINKNYHDFPHRILVNLARQIREGEIKDREKLINRIIEECFFENNDDEQIWRKKIEKRLSCLLDESKKDNPLLVEIIEDSCEKCSQEKQPCAHVCPTGAIKYNDSGVSRINEALCIECGFCVDACISGAIVERSEFAQVAMMLLQAEEYPVYAILAPSFVGQFGKKVTPEILKGALRTIGFTEVYEVAMAADVTTVAEAEEFCKRMERGEKFMITSCCCPAFIKLVEKIRPKVAHLVSPSVSPMIAMGRMLKKREKDCRVVFIGPCIAKKAEAKRPDLQPAIDCVLTFKETKALIEAAEAKLDGSLGSMEVEDASHDGRIYAHTGGVTEAITRAIKKLSPEIEIKPLIGNGLKQCNQILKQIEEGKVDANFMEGMGCPGGCVGGPGTIIEVEEAAKFVNMFAERAHCLECEENEYAMRWRDEYYLTTDVDSVKKDMKMETKDLPEYSTYTREYFN
ncbi:[Fe-Fe] hydrogenase large subunit C-terminal domain-containing protein [Desulfolucanica intricata]|uniref:[Fe-Fe] hydrogenase large subunit C-terminal domain-containing protein n=1 Tax=Desulfolucanica intricata TaxID=1285191 RepID=UPI00082F8DCA|nr:[Fe-Fe] hydrogenase large subunit C-terminal domain-containing protein [Desulfolucanica intricata]